MSSRTKRAGDPVIPGGGSATICGVSEVVEAYDGVRQLSLPFSGTVGA